VLLIILSPVGAEITIDGRLVSVPATLPMTSFPVSNAPAFAE